MHPFKAKKKILGRRDDKCKEIDKIYLKKNKKKKEKLWYANNHDEEQCEWVQYNYFGIELERNCDQRKITKNIFFRNKGVTQKLPSKENPLE